MIDARSGQSGMAVIELLVAMTLMVVVSSVVLSAFEAFDRASDRNAALTQTQDAARSTMGTMARSLRNASAIELSDYDLRFQTDRPDFGVAPSAAGYRVRYCLNDATRQLWLQVAASGAGSPGATCPDPGWGTQQQVIASGVTNRRDGLARPLFAPSPASQPRSMRIELWVIADPMQSAQETRLESAVFVRSLSETAPSVEEDEVEVDCTDPDRPLLQMTTTTDGLGLPLNYTVSENGSVIGNGHSVVLTPGSHTLTITVTNALGAEQVFTKSVSC